jgi:hypothetical protein
VVNIQTGKCLKVQRNHDAETELELRNWHRVIYTHISKPEPQEFIIWYNKHEAWAEGMKHQ